MKNNLLFDFITDKEKNTLTIKREFVAGRQLVWDCHTKAELLNQWFAPKPLKTKTKHMDFREGGYWLYAMIDPQGPEYWGRTDYKKITPIESYETLDAFSDETGAVNPNLPRAEWVVTFTPVGGDKTLVQTVVTYKSLEALETVLNMGMQEGMMSTLERLDDLLLTLKK
jgi:uncharacterized protein YndB with AHSA1/START domain